MKDYQDMPRITRAEEARSLIATGRKMTGLSQEQLAERLHVSPRTLRRYEAGELETPDDLMLKVAEFAECPLLVYKHMKVKYGINDEILPDLDDLTLSQAVVKLLHELADLEEKKVASRLLMLASDGVIDPREDQDFLRIMSDLNDVCIAVDNLRYCRKE